MSDRPRRKSSILKTPKEKKRAPLQDVNTLSHVNPLSEEDATAVTQTYARRKVSFAGTNFVKEFYSESVSVWHGNAPAYEETLSSDSSGVPSECSSRISRTFQSEQSTLHSVSQAAQVVTAEVDYDDPCAAILRQFGSKSCTPTESQPVAPAKKKRFSFGEPLSPQLPPQQESSTVDSVEKPSPVVPPVHQDASTMPPASSSVGFEGPFDLVAPDGTGFTDSDGWRLDVSQGEDGVFPEEPETMSNKASEPSSAAEHFNPVQRTGSNGNITHANVCDMECTSVVQGNIQVRNELENKTIFSSTAQQFYPAQRGEITQTGNNGNITHANVCDMEFTSIVQGNIQVENELGNKIVSNGCVQVENELGNKTILDESGMDFTSAVTGVIRHDVPSEMQGLAHQQAVVPLACPFSSNIGDGFSASKFDRTRLESSMEMTTALPTNIKEWQELPPIRHPGFFNASMGHADSPPTADKTAIFDESMELTKVVPGKIEVNIPFLRSVEEIVQPTVIENVDSVKPVSEGCPVNPIHQGITYYGSDSMEFTKVVVGGIQTADIHCGNTAEKTQCMNETMAFTQVVPSSVHPATEQSNANGSQETSHPTESVECTNAGHESNEDSGNHSASVGLKTQVMNETMAITEMIPSSIQVVHSATEQANAICGSQNTSHPVESVECTKAGHQSNENSGNHTAGVGHKTQVMNESMAITETIPSSIQVEAPESMDTVTADSEPNPVTGEKAQMINESIATTKVLSSSIHVSKSTSLVTAVSEGSGNNNRTILHETQHFNESLDFTQGVTGVCQEASVFTSENREKSEFCIQNGNNHLSDKTIFVNQTMEFTKVVTSSIRCETQSKSDQPCCNNLTMDFTRGVTGQILSGTHVPSAPNMIPGRAEHLSQPLFGASGGGVKRNSDGNAANQHGSTHEGSVSVLLQHKLQDAHEEPRESPPKRFCDEANHPAGQICTINIIPPSPECSEVITDARIVPRSCSTSPNTEPFPALSPAVRREGSSASEIAFPNSDAVVQASDDISRFSSNETMDTNQVGEKVSQDSQPSHQSGISTVGDKDVTPQELSGGKPFVTNQDIIMSSDCLPLKTKSLLAHTPPRNKEEVPSKATELKFRPASSAPDVSMADPKELEPVPVPAKTTEHVNISDVSLPNSLDNTPMDNDFLVKQLHTTVEVASKHVEAMFHEPKRSPVYMGTGISDLNDGVSSECHVGEEDDVFYTDPSAMKVRRSSGLGTQDMTLASKSLCTSTSRTPLVDTQPQIQNVQDIAPAVIKVLTTTNELGTKNSTNTSKYSFTTPGEKSASTSEPEVQHAAPVKTNPKVIEDIIQEHETKVPCYWTSKKLDGMLWSFKFKATKLELQIKLCPSILPKDCIAATDGVFISHVVDSTKPIIRWTMGILMKKLSTGEWSKELKSTRHLMRLLYDVSVVVEEIVHFTLDLISLEGTQSLKVTHESASFSVFSMVCHVWFRVVLKLDSWENYTPSHVRVENLVGTTREPVVQNLVSGVKKNILFVRNYIRDVKDYLKTLEKFHVTK